MAANDLRDAVLVKHINVTGGIASFSCYLENTSDQIMSQVVLDIYYFNRKKEEIKKIQYNALKNGKSLLAYETRMINFTNKAGFDQ